MRTCCLLIALIASVGTTPRLVHAQEAQRLQLKLAPVAPNSVQAAFDVMMGALSDESYTAFISVADEGVKTTLTKAMFDEVVKQVKARLKSGYESTYLGTLKQHGYDVHLWRLTFKDGGDDFLAQLSWKDDKVGGFFLR